MADDERSGETSVDGARRELREETGLDVALSSFESVARLREQRALFDIYVARWNGDAPLALDAAEVAAAQWLTWAGVDRLCRDRRMAEPWIARLGRIGEDLREAARASVR